MKKELRLILGTLVLVLILFAGAFLIYKNKESASSNNGETSNAPAIQEATLLIKDWSPSIGPVMSRVVLVEFLDPECESCRAMHPIVKKVLKDYEGKIRYVLRYMTYHKNSGLAVKWLEAAGVQGKFWEALNALFEKQPQWASHHDPRPDLIPSILSEVGVDVAQAKSLLNNPEFEKIINQDKQDGTKAGVSGTPTFFINGQMLLELGEEPLRNSIDAALNSNR